MLRLYFGIFQSSVVTFHTLPPAPSHFIRILLRAQGLLEDHNPIRGDDVLHNEMATGSSSEVRNYAARGLSLAAWVTLGRL